jgi:hypothetical protein
MVVAPVLDGVGAVPASILIPPSSVPSPTQSVWAEGIAAAGRCGEIPLPREVVEVATAGPRPGE